MHQVTLKQLQLFNFKNYESISLSFDERIICFAGNNGEGKTNLLDAIYYLCFCKGFINNADSLSIKNHESFFTIQGSFHLDENIESIYCAFKRDDSKVFKKNKKEYQRLSEHIGLIPLVLMSPADIFLIYEGSELRRKFIDGIISQFDSNYLHLLLQYNKALVQRNALLKQMSEGGRFNKELIEVWNDQLSGYGQKIYESRCKFIAGFTSVFIQQYNLLSHLREEVGLAYESQMHQETLSNLLLMNAAKDAAAKHTTVGIHKDDLVFMMDGKPLKKVASQGQQKTFLLALRLAQYHYIKELKKQLPILLIDDVYDKLDPSRVKHLFEVITEKHFGQVFITDTNTERIAKIFHDIGSKFQLFEVANGLVTQTN